MFDKLARDVDAELTRLRTGGQEAVKVAWDDKRKGVAVRVLGPETATESVLPATVLRQKCVRCCCCCCALSVPQATLDCCPWLVPHSCQCAICVEELTGEVRWERGLQVA